MRPPQITRRAIAEKVWYRKWHDPPLIVWISVIVCQSKIQTQLCSDNLMYHQPLLRNELTDQLVDSLVQSYSLATHHWHKSSHWHCIICFISLVPTLAPFLVTRRTQRAWYHLTCA